MLFKKKKDPAREQPKAPPPQKSAPAPSAAGPSTAEQDNQQAVRFSGRIAGVFGKMYRAILSADLQMNVYQVESGELGFGGAALPVRGYYDAWYQQLQQSMSPESRDRFAADFDRKRLGQRLREGAAGCQGVYYVAKEQAELEPDEGLAYTSWEIRADRIPDEGGQRIRCILYLRPVQDEAADRPQEAPAGPEEAPDTRDWDGIRLRKLLGGQNPVFFEYDTDNDCMYINRPGKAGRGQSVQQNYTGSLDARGDWMVFHSDVQTVKKLLRGAGKGKFGTAEIQYRAGGRHSSEFRLHRIVCAPVEDGEKARWVVGALTDISGETQQDQLKQDIYSHMVKLLASLYTSMFEIDWSKGMLYTIRYSEDSFLRDEKPRKLEEYINSSISKGVIEAEYAGQYRNWLQEGFLERKTANGSYEFECRLKLPGSLEYRWYSETIYRVTNSQRYLRVRRDTTDNHAIQRRKYEMEEQSRYVEYNRKLLDTMAGLVEFRNIESGAHISNVRRLTRILLEDIAARTTKYRLTHQQIDMYSEASTMHDIGKIAVPDHILNKPGKLTEEERKIMQLHTVNGERIACMLNLPGQEELIACCRDVALHHHERYDGSGYPDGLVGDKITVGAQAVSIADVFDALASVRVYKGAMSMQEAYDVIVHYGQEGSFNPLLVESFKACFDKLQDVYADQIEEAPVEDTAPDDATRTDRIEEA